MKKRWALLIVSMLCIALTTTACTSGVAPNPGKSDGAASNKTEEERWKEEPMYGKKIKVGYSGGLCTGALGLAKAFGYYEKEGLDVDIINVQQESDAIGTNQVQMTSSHIATLLVPAVNGVNMVFTTGAQTGCKSLYVLNDDKIKSTSDLIGKTVAVPDGIGKSDHNIALRFFNHDKIDPRTVKFKQVEPSATILAMQNGEVQGTVLSDQFAEKFVKAGTLKSIRSITWDEDFKEEPCCVHALNKTFVEQNPITAKKMTKAVKEVSLFINDNIEKSAQALFDNNWASGDFEQACRMMRSYDWKITDEAAEKALVDIIDDYKSFGLIDPGKDTQKVLQHVWNPLLKTTAQNVK